MLRILAILSIFSFGLILADRVSIAVLTGLPSGASVNWAEIDGCNTTVCRIKRGDAVSITMEFVSGGYHEVLTAKVSGSMLGISLILPLDDNDACKMNVNCPLNKGDVNILKESATIPTSYPSGKVTVKFEITDGKRVLVAGFTTPITLL